ncbi:type I polyketide synthase [Solilutibacter silvestris]|uniref:AA-adenyl-dom: amino acid adenylation domain n=1 Tax=Solilutibacter silvestris TaxID=1645665 RepID=A0A2K1PZB7_9GAMM|nr:type I polyketide synthase [Lysobacter silvestris]PNS08133.1 AA-adenyl-dom: amino acid adenylation domain [Lysobacter silvestris]
MNPRATGTTNMIAVSPLRGARSDRAETLSASLVDAFLVHVRQRPGATAIRDGERCLDYAQLDAISAAVAAGLRERGVGHGDIVALDARRGADALIAMLAILRCGAAYLPLDPAQPMARLATILANANVRLCLVSLAGNTTIRLPDAITKVAIEDCAIATAVDADVQRSGEDLAYVMFTSGSTGTPKGVCIPDRAIVGLVCDVDFIALDAGSVFLQAAPLGFDASTLEIWGALLNGGQVVIHPEAVPTAAGLGETIRRHGITHLWLTAALFNSVVDDDPHQLHGVRQLFSGGEALSLHHVRRMRAAEPDVALFNGYGPTECTTFAVTHAITDVADGAHSVPIGHAIDRARLFVVDGDGQPVRDGEQGELWIAGSGVASGYLGRADLTVERFVAAPDGIGMAYRSGDQVRVNETGCIEFCGRFDQQVKVRGFRIELGEIEAVLGAVPGICNAAVTAPETVHGERRLVAYLQAQDGKNVDVEAIRTQLAGTLPDYMVPLRYVVLERFPVTANGKLDRAALPPPDRTRPEIATPHVAPRGDREMAIARAMGELLDIDGVGRDDSFFDLGGSSLLAARLVAMLKHDGILPLSASPGHVFSHPAPALLAAHFESSRQPQAQPAQPAATRNGSEAIAIIAMAGRFPGAVDVEAFWSMLCEGREGITRFDRAALDPSIPDTLRNDPDYVPARGVIAGVEQFDAAFFGIGAPEAEVMDPQQRIALELAWECMERGGHAPGDEADGDVGVFAGMYNASYFQKHVSQHPDRIARVGEFQTMLGNEKDYIATRVAHKLGLTGPAISIHTGCSTSLVAICQAVESLRAGQCRMALAGGVSVTCPSNSGYLHQEGSMLSPDGHTRSFDAKSAGTVFSDGAAMVLLKRLADAQADGDPIHAVIRGVGLSNDGAQRASFTAPSAAGQARAIRMAHRDAGVDPRSIGYIEAHGTATPIGDPIEIEGLALAFTEYTQDTGFCTIGSLKSNVGHLVIAAGAAGMIKTALALRENVIPGTLHFTAANPAIDFASTPFVANAEADTWRCSPSPRRAGVSSFGVGGTNAHVVMEQAPDAVPSDAAAGVQLLQLSACSPQALQQASERLAMHLADHPDANLADVAWTLRSGRKVFAYRRAVVADGRDAAIRDLQLPASTPTRMAGGDTGVVLLFPGQGATYPGMGRALYRDHQVFRDAIDACAEHLGDRVGEDLRTLLFSDDTDALRPTSRMQPATFALEYALGRLWQSLGVMPVAMLGHSIGEFTAATLAGVFSLDDAIGLVARRAALMQSQPAGAMLGVRLSEAELLARLPVDLDLAAVNGPRACVVSGRADMIEAFVETLAKEQIACTPLRTSHAFHSRMMEPALASFADAVATCSRNAPSLPIVSSLTGMLLTGDEAISVDYWVNQLRAPVQYSRAAACALALPAVRALLETGPRNTLSQLAKQQRFGDGQFALASLADNTGAENATLLQAAAALWCAGIAVDIDSLDARQQRHRVELPTYPFERKTYWLPAPTAALRAPVAIHEESSMPASHPAPVAQPAAPNTEVIARIREVFEDVSGIDMAGMSDDANFVEAGLDSLTLTQIALQLQKSFGTKISFRQLMSEYSSLTRLGAALGATVTPARVEPQASVPTVAAAVTATVASIAVPTASTDLQQLMQQQMQLMQRQLELLGAAPVARSEAAMPQTSAVMMPRAPMAAATTAQPQSSDQAEAEALAHTRYDVKKAFGAIARIDNGASSELGPKQRDRLDAFIQRYVARTQASKDYTQRHRGHLADPRVVNGFKPMLKEITYQIVMSRSQGAHLTDLDGNDYVDALNGFGMSLFGWQPDFVLDAVRTQLDAGYEIGPQHVLAGEVAELFCEITGNDRAALCNTGSEAVLGALRIARTVTGRDTVAVFSGAYHGIIDEMIVRGTRTHRAVPAAPGILRNTAEHVVVLDYGTEESAQWLREHASELAAVLVEPVQSRRPDFQPVEFLKELRAITDAAGALLVFDEVVTGFRAHPAGTQGLFGIRADLATYGKVVGGGFPIGVIAGKRDYMDALDGGDWQFGDDSVPSVGVTYFAGTFVRHPLALAAAAAVLKHLKAQGPELQVRLNQRVATFVDDLNRHCAAVGAPVAVRHFASVWKTFFREDHALQDLLFAMMRSRGIHILDNFPCFFTTAHSEADFARIAEAFKASIDELQDAGFLPKPKATAQTVMDASAPRVAGARLGRDPQGQPAWYAPDPETPGQYVKVEV